MKLEKSTAIPYEKATLRAFITDGSLTSNNNNQLTPVHFYNSTILSFNQNYTPELTRLTLLTPCNAYTTGSQSITEFWLEKQGGKNLYLTKKPEPILTDFYQFKLPKAITKTFSIYSHQTI